MGTFIRFMQRPVGRGLRIVVGLALIALGIWGVGGFGGFVLAILGMIPLIAGAAGICLIAPFFGYTLVGDPVRPTHQA